MYLQKKSDWVSFHRVYFLAEDSVELNLYTILYTRKTIIKTRMKYMYKRVFQFILKLEIGRVEDKNGTTIVTDRIGKDRGRNRSRTVNKISY